MLERDGLVGVFESVIGYEDVGAPKPDPEGLRLALQRLRTTSDYAVYIGDSVTDAKTAQAAGVPFVAVLTGMTTEFEFAVYQPAAVLASAALLPGWLASAEEAHQ